MNSTPKHNHDHEHDPADDPASANDNGEHARETGAVAPAPAGGALTSLAALATALNSVDTTSVTGRSGRPLLQFKSREDGTWMFGQRRITVEADSLWAVNPTTFKWGFVCFSDTNKVIGERLVSVFQPQPDITKLPDTGHEWQAQWAVDLKCVAGTDTGTEVVFKSTTNGGEQAVVGLLNTTRDRLNGGQHNGKVVPIVRLERDSYPHPERGRIWIPVMTIVDWMPLEGPAPAPKAPPSPPSSDPQQPRRRRVA